MGGLIPIGLDGGLQLLTSYESNNLFRLLTGGLAGIVTTLALGWVIYDMSKSTEMKRILALEPVKGEEQTQEQRKEESIDGEQDS